MHGVRYSEQINIFSIRDSRKPSSGGFSVWYNINMAEYTHDFKLDFDGATYEGQLEFNAAGIVSHEFDETYKFTLEQTDSILELLRIWSRLFKAFGNNIKLLRLKEK